MGRFDFWQPTRVVDCREALLLEFAGTENSTQLGDIKRVALKLHVSQMSVETKFHLHSFFIEYYVTIIQLTWLQLDFINTVMQVSVKEMFSYIYLIKQLEHHHCFAHRCDYRWGMRSTHPIYPTLPIWPPTIWTSYWNITSPHSFKWLDQNVHS